MRIKKISIPLYSGWLILHQTDDLKEVQDKYNLTDISGCDGIAFVLEDKSGIMNYYMAFESKTTAEIIAHEALHITNYIMDRHCIRPDLINDEPQAYLLGWIVKQCDKFINKKN